MISVNQQTKGETMETGEGKRGPGRPRKKQTELPITGRGAEALDIPEIDEAAEAYVEVRDRRQALTEKEVAAKDKLLGLMKGHKLSKYVFDGRLVEVVPIDETVKVKKLPSPDED